MVHFSLKFQAECNKKFITSHGANENYFFYNVYTFQGVKGAKIPQKVSLKCSETKLNFLPIGTPQILYGWLQ